ncbi:hypothetical protein [Halomontanus rarus]|nr:hypothetical protein [Halovivax sp. TS33]
MDVHSMRAVGWDGSGSIGYAGTVRTQRIPATGQQPFRAQY